MAGSQILVFESYRLDLGREQLRRGGDVIPLTNKAFAVLRYLVAHAEQLVTRDALLEAVWPGVFVSEAALTVCIYELRQALKETAQAPRFIETVRGRGYRFLAPVTASVPAPTRYRAVSAASPQSTLTHSQFASLEGGELGLDPPIAAPLLATRMPEAERRQLTVMFCDVVESTALAEQFDPEDFREIVRSYQSACSEVIQRYEGYVAQLLGDGLLVYFGYPHAHEDDAQRAVRTGLEIVAAIGNLHTRLEQTQGVRLAVRVGMHTGLVVVGDMGVEGRQEQLAFGATPNIAARIQGLADPHSVVISEATYRLVQGYFVCHDLGAQTLRGVAEPIAVYRILRESGAQSRLEISSSRGFTPLVGRDAEVTLLRDRWEQVKGGQGQVVVLSGEAGIGKSRLVQTLQDEVVEHTHSRFECRSSPYHQHTVLYPITDLLQRTWHVQADDPSEAKLAKLEQALSASRLSLQEAVPLFATLLSLALPADRYPPLHLSPQRQRQKTLESIVSIVLDQAEQQPTLLILEDLHWTDPSTVALLDLMLEQTPTVSLLVCLTCRPEFQLPWSHRSYLTEITVSRLSRQHIAQMVERLTGGKHLPAEVLEHIGDKTDGVPLYVEELTKAVVESGVLQETDGQYELTGPLASLAIPATLQDSLMARLDRLATAKGVAQVAATMGRQFSYALLHAVSQLDEATLQRELDRLVAAELVYPRGLPPQVTYVFKHALIQEAAYQSLLHSTRQHYHQRIAHGLEVQFPETVELQPELVAHHYTAAGRSDQAIPYWQQAGQHAVQRCAHVEATHHLRTALELLAALPDTDTRQADELVLLTMLGPSLTAIKGWASPDVGEAYTRALELCRQLGDPPERFAVLRGLWEFYEARAEYQTAREFGEQLLRLAQRDNDAVLLIVAHDVLGDTLFWLGEFAASQEHIAQGMALYDRQRHHTHAVRFSAYDPGVLCLYFAALNLWWLGYPHQALQRVQETLTLAQALQHPYSMVFARCAVAWVHQLRGEPHAGLQQAEMAVALSTEQGLELLLAWGTILRGWALAGQGQGGMAQMRQGLAAWQETGAELLRPYFLALIAEAYGKEKQVETGLNVLDEALQLVETTGERFWEAEIYRLKGELSLLRGESQIVAQGCFDHALDVARCQRAKSLELRVQVSLSRLWQQEGKRQEALVPLKELYGWFTEGFDTADLQAAKSLLAEVEG